MTPSAAATGHARPTAMTGMRGIATVEFALVAPLLCLVLFATAELGRAFVEYMILSYAVRDSVRYVSQNALNGTTGVLDFTTAHPNTIPNAKNLVVYDNVGGTGATRLPGLASGQVSVTSFVVATPTPSASYVQVAVAYPYQPMIGSTLPTFGFGAAIPLTFNMTITVTMRAIT